MHATKSTATASPSTGVASAAQSPYVGLIPYSADDARFFFGRETETEIVSANLRAARLTVLYGASGVGKSSVLQAGVVHNLRELARADAATYGQAEFAVIMYRDWARDPRKGIAAAAHAAVAEALGITTEVLEPVPETGDLTKLLQAWAQRYSLELLIILDQFEELFNYLADAKSPCAVFAEQFAQAVNTPSLSARFLISLRGDTLSLLDYFKDKIPGLFDNRLQIKHLSVADARRAITEPVAAYNDLYHPVADYLVEPQLVNEVVSQVQIGRVEFAGVERSALAGGDLAAPVAPAGKAQDETQTFVETPYLQLVMKRIWREEIAAGSNVLQWETLTKKLGGANNIIQTHLDDVMQTLSDDERKTAASCFKYLVTPMGTKVALTPTALAKYTDDDEPTIKAVLDLLIKGKPQPDKSRDIKLPVAPRAANGNVAPPDEARILRIVEIPVGKKQLSAYEVTHDALIPAILDWRARYMIEHSTSNQIKKYSNRIKRYVIIALPVIALAGLIAVLVSAAVTWRFRTSEVESAQTNANQSQRNANQLQQNANQLKNQLKDKASEANDDATIAQINTTLLVKALIELSSESRNEREQAIAQLKDLIAQGKIPPGFENSIIQLVAKTDQQKAAELRAAAKTNLTATNSNLPNQTRIFIHITDGRQRDIARQFQKLFADKHISAPGIEDVSNLKLNLSKTQIRYFYPDDLNLAGDILRLVQTQGIQNVQVRYIAGYADSPNVKPRQLELWFANDVSGSSDSSAK